MMSAVLLYEEEGVLKIFPLKSKDIVAVAEAIKALWEENPYIKPIAVAEEKKGKWFIDALRGGSFEPVHRVSEKEYLDHRAYLLRDEIEPASMLALIIDCLKGLSKASGIDILDEVRKGRLQPELAELLCNCREEENVKECIMDVMGW